MNERPQLEQVFAAAREGDLEVVKQFLTLGGDPNALQANNEGTIVGLLHVAMDKAAHGADSEFETRDDRSDMIRLLVENGADVDYVNTSGVAPLAYCEYPGEASVLLDLGANVNALDNNGWSALHFYALRFHAVALTRLLLRHGADHNSANNSGQLAEDVHATYYGQGVKDGRSAAGLLADVRRAGGWAKYARAPRIELARLRSLCARGRATPPPNAVLERLFNANAQRECLYHGVCNHSTHECAVVKSLVAAAKENCLAGWREDERGQRSRRMASRALPNEVFWHILRFWRSSREVDD